MVLHVNFMKYITWKALIVLFIVYSQICVQSATRSIIVNTTNPVTPGRIPYLVTGTRIVNSPIARIDANSIAVTNAFLAGCLTRGTLSLSGTNTTTDWTATDRYTYTLSASSTNTHINVTTNASIAQYLSIIVTSDDGLKTIDFVLPAGITTNWISAFVRYPRIGQTEFGFYPRGSTLDIWAWPDTYPTANGQVYRQASGTNGFGAITLSSANAVTGVLPIANIATGTPDGTKFVRDDGTLQTPSGSTTIGYVLTLMSTGFNPADSTTYYFGSDIISNPGNVYTNFSVRIPKNGTIKVITLRTRNTGLGTTENVVQSLRLNDTTDIALADADYDASVVETTASVTQAVVAGDYITGKIVAPAWVTNPTSTRWYMTVYIE